jgi:hypothetical protein
VDLVHRSTVDRVKGYELLLIWAADLHRTAVAACRRRAALYRRRAAGRRRLAAAARRRIAGDGQQALPCTKTHGKTTRRKRGARGRLPGARREGKCAGGGDRAAAPAVAAVLRGGGGAVREERKEGARGVEEALLPFYSPEGEGEEARWRWSGSSPVRH